MHAVIINGSPRTEKYSNTDKIIDSFAAGLTDAGADFEKHSIWNRGNWDAARRAYCENTEIIIAIPLYVECIPGILLEFLETLPRKDSGTRLSFILQSGFAEAGQLRCGEEFLKKLPSYLGVSFGGTLIKGDNFGIRLSNDEEVRKLTAPYRETGRAFVTENGFSPETCAKFAGPEYFSLPVRLLLQLMFRTVAKKKFKEAAQKWGCTVPIDHKPWT